MNVQRYESYWTDESPSLTDPLTASRRRFLWERVAPYLGPNSRLLDCGAGDGGLLAEARDSRHRSCGDRDRRRRYRACPTERSRDRHQASFSRGASLAGRAGLLGRRSLLRGDRALARAPLAPQGRPHRPGRWRHILREHPLPRPGEESGGCSLQVRESLRRRRGSHPLLHRPCPASSLETAGFEVVEIAHLGRVWPLWANTVVLPGRHECDLDVEHSDLRRRDDEERRAESPRSVSPRSTGFEESSSSTPKR